MSRHPQAAQVALRRYDEIMSAAEQPPARAVTTAAAYAGIERHELQTLLAKRGRG